MDKKLVKFIKEYYQMAVTSRNMDDILAYMDTVVGACSYEYERTGDWDALNLWTHEWKDKFAALLEN